MLAGLGHGAVRGGDHQDRAVHLGRAGDHVLDVVGVAWAVHMRVVALGGRILDVGRVDRDPAGLFFGGLVNLVIALGRAPPVLDRIVAMAAVSVVLPWST